VPTTQTTGKRHLVIVESPAKARIIQGYLGGSYTVLSSVGHIRDLPKSAADVPAEQRGTAWARTGVDVDNGFAPLYVVGADRKPLIRELKQALSQSDELLLATDEDREGEAIAWHLVQVLKPTVPYRRMVFHEITKDAIQHAADSTRELDFDLVDAQETRRIVDRLFGYELSPVLWRRVSPRLSAGRVQSVALRLVVDRERERIAFTAAGYCDIKGKFTPGPFSARLITVDGVRIATGKDFDDVGRLMNESVRVLDRTGADELAAGLADRTFTVSSVDRRPGTRRPGAPFMTSTLQQEAGRRLRWTAKRVMDTAQRLYEGGYITYMRTDSTTLSAQALQAAREQVRDLYGDAYLPDTPRRYDRKVKNAQEAHEAIRPAGDRFRSPGEVSGALRGDQFSLYELIWKRTIASQMVDAKVATTTIRLTAQTESGVSAQFSAAGTVVVFPGFLAAYADVDSDDEGDGAKPQQVKLPALRQGDEVAAVELLAEDHTTTPPARYTEASLIKALEEMGIGRPSTFAAIVNTILDRNYVTKRGSALVPSYLGMTVTRLLEEHFAPLVDYSFTARMEETLDAVANGDESRLRALERFYRGDDVIEFDGLMPLIERGGDIDARALSTFAITGSEAVVRLGRYGPYLQRGESDRANFPEELAPDELTAAKVEEIFAQPRGDRELGVDPDTGRTIVVKAGRFGPFVTEVMPEDADNQRPRTASLFADMDLQTVGLDDALRLLSLPREVGVDPADGQAILALNGRYGPYIKKGEETRSLAEQSQIFTVTVDDALRLLAEPPRRRGQRTAAPGRELGPDPVSGKAVTVKDGRFGPYVTDGEYNATIPKDENAEQITLERAAELLVERRAKGPAKKATRRSAGKTAAAKGVAKKTAARKSSAKRTTTKRTTTKKTTTKKTTTKKTATKAPGKRAAAKAPAESAPAQS
jgi:DNA topoisomerase-1